MNDINKGKISVTFEDGRKITVPYKTKIVDAIKRPLGAKDLDGIKRRTRAGAGRCQAGFCLTRTAMIYLALVMLLSRGVTLLERRLRRSDR
jgi:hypothetical protein